MTGREGWNVVGLVPVVIPSPAIHATASAKKSLAFTSVNGSDPPFGLPLSRQTNVANSPRVTLRSGLKQPGDVPVVMPSSSSHWTGAA